MFDSVLKAARGYSCVPIKLYLQKQMASWPVCQLLPVCSCQPGLSLMGMLHSPSLPQPWEVPQATQAARTPTHRNPAFTTGPACRGPLLWGKSDLGRSSHPRGRQGSSLPANSCRRARAKALPTTCAPITMIWARYLACWQSRHWVSRLQPPEVAPWKWLLSGPQKVEVIKHKTVATGLF